MHGGVADSGHFKSPRFQQTPEDESPIKKSERRMSPVHLVDSDPYNFNSDQLPKMSSTPGNPRNNNTPPIVTFQKNINNKEEHIVVEAIDNSGINLL